MKCPTCGKPVKTGQSICSYCGGMVAPESAKPTIGPGPSSPPPSGSAGPPGPVVFEEIQPAAVEDIQPERGAWTDGMPRPGAPPAQPPPAVGGPQPPATPRSKPPAWTRLASLAFYVLVFMVLQYFMRDSQRDAANRAPALQTAGTYDRIDHGAPAHPKSVFSIEQDRQVVFLSVWRGDPKQHHYKVAWRAPSGSATADSPAVDAPASASGQDVFTVSATLALQPGLQTGLWRAVVSQDDEDIGESSFQIIQ